MTPDPETTLALPVTEETLTLPVVPEPADTRPFAGASLAGLPDPDASVTLIPAGDAVLMRAAPEPRPFPWMPIGDHLISSLPGFDSLPCGHCGAVFADAPPDVLTRVRPLGVLRHYAYEAGWQYDETLTWTCPECAAAAADAATEWDRAWAEAARGPGYPDVLAEFDRKAKATLARIEGEFDPSCWRYEEPATGAWAA